MRSQFDPARITPQGRLTMSGTVTLDPGEARPEGLLRVAWVARQHYWATTGGVTVVELEKLTWEQTDVSPGLWEPTVPVEAFAMLLSDRFDHLGDEPAESVDHPGAFVWSQSVAVAS